MEKYAVLFCDKFSRQTKRARGKVNHVIAPAGLEQIKQHHNRQSLVAYRDMDRCGGRLWHRNVLIGIKIIALLIHISLAACKNLA